MMRFAIGVVVGLVLGTSLSTVSSPSRPSEILCSQFFGFSGGYRATFVAGVLSTLDELYKAGLLGRFGLRQYKDLDDFEIDLRGACRLYPEVNVTRLTLYVYGFLPPP